MNNLQEIFDKAVGGVLKQGGPSISYEDKVCQYNNGNGRKCAAGHLIPDDEYDVLHMEGQNFMDIEYPSKPTNASELELVAMLQRAHDKPVQNDLRISDWDFISDFKDRVKEIAMRYNLDIGVIDENG